MTAPDAASATPARPSDSPPSPGVGHRSPITHPSPKRPPPEPVLRPPPEPVLRPPPEPVLQPPPGIDPDWRERIEIAKEIRAATLIERRARHARAEAAAEGRLLPVGR